jgi:lysophospholipase L1-like esterase
LKSKDSNYVSLEEFEKNIEELIEKSRKFTQEIFFIGLTKSDESKVLPVPWVPDFYCKNENIKIYNDKIKEVCEKNDIHFIEMLDLLNNEDLKDGLHPSSEGHKKMFLRIKDYLKENSII